MPFSPSIVNGSECYVNFACQQAGTLAPYTPTSLEYQVWNVTNPFVPVNVVQPTEVTPEASGIITLTSTVNTMASTSSTYENRIVTVKAGIPGGTYINSTIPYTLLRQPGTP